MFSLPYPASPSSSPFNHILPRYFFNHLFIITCQYLLTVDPPKRFTATLRSLWSIPSEFAFCFSLSFFSFSLPASEKIPNIYPNLSFCLCSSYAECAPPVELTPFIFTLFALTHTHTNTHAYTHKHTQTHARTHTQTHTETLLYHC